MMGSEIELKFQVSSQEMGSLRAARSLSVYFDTAGRRLRRKGISLRVRHDGGGRIQTIKTKTSGIPFSRGQWEHKIDGDQHPICDSCGARRLRSCGPKS
jgi:triphosphatase